MIPPGVVRDIYYEETLKFSHECHLRVRTEAGDNYCKTITAITYVNFTSYIFLSPSLIDTFLHIFYTLILLSGVIRNYVWEFSIFCSKFCGWPRYDYHATNKKEFYSNFHSFRWYKIPKFNRTIKNNLNDQFCFTLQVNPSASNELHRCSPVLNIRRSSTIIFSLKNKRTRLKLSPI